MDLDALHPFVVLGVIGIAAPVFVVLLGRTAPYGRHTTAAAGPTLGARAGWVLMESPSAVLFAAVFAAGGAAGQRGPQVLAALWLLHYVYRAFIFPFRLRGRPIPVGIVAGGFGFNVVNAWLNARQLSALGHYPDTWLADPRFVAGALLFLAGWAVNHHADAVLLGLRARGGGYSVPQGGLYRWVSCPNYLGELVEWAGWALATWSPAGLAFFVFTFANLAPRALAHHRWYRATFPDYPAERKALVPGVW